MDDFAVCFAVCQAELYAQVASKMQEEILKLPQDKVATIQSRVREHIKKGGAFISDTKSSLQVATDVLSGKAPITDAVKAVVGVDLKALDGGDTPTTSFNSE